MKVVDHGIGFLVTLKLDKITVHLGAWQSSGATQMQGPAVNFTWLHVQGHIVLQLDHENAGTQCEGDILGADKLGFVFDVAAGQGHVWLTVALFVVFCC